MTRDLFDQNQSGAVERAALLKPSEEASKYLSEKANHELVEECRAMFKAGINDDDQMLEVGKKIPELHAESKKVDKLRLSFMKPIKAELADVKKEADAAKKKHTDSKAETNKAEGEFKEFMETLDNAKRSLTRLYDDYIAEKQRKILEAERKLQEEITLRAMERSKNRDLWDGIETLPEVVKPAAMAASVAAQVESAATEIVQPGAFKAVLEQPPVVLIDHDPATAPKIETEHGTLYQKKELEVVIEDGDKVPEDYKVVTVKYKIKELKEAYAAGVKHIPGVNFVERMVSVPRT